MPSAVDACTQQAYRETEYRVDHVPPFSLEVGRSNPALAALYRQLRVNCCAFVTAANPLSQLLPDDENIQRTTKLAKELQRRGLTIIEGIGQHPDNKWPGEKSFLILGMSLEAAKTLGRKYEQNAIVWCGADAVAQLILLR